MWEPVADPASLAVVAVPQHGVGLPRGEKGNGKRGKASTRHGPAPTESKLRSGETGRIQDDGEGRMGSGNQGISDQPRRET